MKNIINYLDQFINEDEDYSKYDMKHHTKKIKRLKEEINKYIKK